MIGRIGVWGMGGVGKTTLIKNLNNKLISGSTSSSGRPFSIVIWVTVSKKLDEKRIQQEMAERLGLKVNSEDNVEKMAILLHQRLLKEEKFLLILDDVWEKIDLDRLGVPSHETHKGSRIILTSRSSEVCREMMVDFELKVNTTLQSESRGGGASETYPAICRGSCA
ncbi:hypothetical protein TIFTF001_038317 [Ficus carica]|uniref:NB-ARC domain-containing protein n=1 Tax=Ficus carica TaxID=3494 RepID=A0AA88JEF6_FICCA|nr:hypothetical protein TIFTF001_038305 [Ficus carica]GMN69257.1 hypothetical protein TIFTF001_038308 [Ficus carica]GMN69261.1 hypothetical protein TIFTF001_038314 [Ficus carica]GMN69266.1 hypothetical protein TIFTF001_038317 [Ficus carica]